MKKIFCVGIVIIFIVVLIFFVPKSKEVDHSKHVIFGNTKVNVEIVNTEATRELGLSGRVSLPYNSGMLFVFDNAGSYSFWMKDMRFAIDIIWLDAHRNIIYIKKDAEPSSFPSTFGGEQNSLYALEVEAGFAKYHNLKIGDHALFDF